MTGLLDRCKVSFDVLSLLFTPSKNSAWKIYDLLSTRNHLTENSLYLNLGYWKNTSDYDKACQALAHLLGEAADISSKDSVLDVGFGFADQDIYWARTFKPKRITGVNITASQVEAARKRVELEGLSETIELTVGSATQLSFKESAFDKVTALETAFHFDTREKFFSEAFRVLRPGGRIATADIIPMMAAPNLYQRTGQYFSRAFWQIPAANMYDREEYARKLKACGFVNVHVRSIREDVYRPFVEFASKRLNDPAVAARMNGLIRAFWKASARDLSIWDIQDYIIATGEKPA